MASDKIIYKTKRSYLSYILPIAGLFLITLFADWKNDNVLFNKGALISYLIDIIICSILSFLTLFAVNRMIISKNGFELKSVLLKNTYYEWSNIKKINMFQGRFFMFSVEQTTGIKRKHTFFTISIREFLKIAYMLDLNEINISLDRNINQLDWKEQAKKKFSKEEIPVFN